MKNKLFIILSLLITTIAGASEREAREFQRLPDIVKEALFSFTVQASRGIEMQPLRITPEGFTLSQTVACSLTLNVVTVLTHATEDNKQQYYDAAGALAVASVETSGRQATVRQAAQMIILGEETLSSKKSLAAAAIPCLAYVKQHAEFLNDLKSKYTIQQIPTTTDLDESSPPR